MLKAWKRLGYLAGWTNAVVDDLATIRPLESSSIKPEYIPGKGVFLHAVRQGTAPVPVEWDVSVAGETATVVTSTVAWGSQILGPPSTATVDLSGMGADDARWVYLQINFETRDLTLALTAAATKAVSDPSNAIARINLAQVKRFTEDGPIVILMKRAVDVDITGGTPL